MFRVIAYSWDKIPVCLKFVCTKKPANHASYLSQTGKREPNVGNYRNSKFQFEGGHLWPSSLINYHVVNHF